jgi:hypothetical protein
MSAEERAEAVKKMTEFAQNAGEAVDFSDQGETLQIEVCDLFFED